MRLVRLWKHLHLLKRGGIGMLPGGVRDADLGSCAVQCPACPREIPLIADDDESLTLNTIEDLLVDAEPPSDPPRQPDISGNGNDDEDEDEMPILIPWDDDDE